MISLRAIFQTGTGSAMNAIQKLGTALAIVSIASAASFANAQDANSASAGTNGASTPESASASQSANLRWGSPPVNRAAAPSDPVPKANTMSERARRFAAQEREYQRLSTP
jgi:hypothetical protein